MIRFEIANEFEYGLETLAAQRPDFLEFRAEIRRVHHKQQ